MHFRLHIHKQEPIKNRTGSLCSAVVDCFRRHAANLTNVLRLVEHEILVRIDVEWRLWVWISEHRNDRNDDGVDGVNGEPALAAFLVLVGVFTWFVQDWDANFACFRVNVRMPHWTNEVHLWWFHREVFWKLKLGWKDWSFIGRTRWPNNCHSPFKDVIIDKPCAEVLAWVVHEVFVHFWEDSRGSIFACHPKILRLSKVTLCAGFDKINWYFC